MGFILSRGDADVPSSRRRLVIAVVVILLGIAVLTVLSLSAISTLFGNLLGD